MGCGWIPCAEDAGNTCGFKCMNLCGAGGFCRTGTCRAAETPERNTIQACDEKRKDGQVCGQDYECQSAHCSGGTCAPAAGAGVGTTCLRPQDCASGNCTNGTCK
jgi:hypothetical protein